MQSVSSGTTRRTLRFNLLVGIASGVLFMPTQRLLAPTTVLGMLALELSGSERWVGLLSCVSTLGSAWAPVLTSKWVEGRRRQMPVYIAAAAGQVLMVAAMAALMFTALPVQRPLLTLYLVVVFSAGRSIAMGVRKVPGLDIVARAIPERLRGVYFGGRRLGGHLLGFGAALLVTSALHAGGLIPFPMSFGALFALAAVMQLAAFALFARIREPTGAAKRNDITMRQHMRRGFRALTAGKAMRLYLGMRIINAAMVVSLVFLTVCAKVRFGMPVAQVGLFIALNAAGTIIGNLIAGWISVRRGDLAALRAASVVALAPPLLALLALRNPGGTYNLPVWGAVAAPVLLLGVAYMLGGVLTSLRVMGELNYLLALAPENYRPTYLGFAQLCGLPISLMPWFAGLLAERSYGAVFAVSLAAAIASMWLSRTALPPPDKARRGLTEIDLDGRRPIGTV